jgi:hypothetical protein
MPFPLKAPCLLDLAALIFEGRAHHGQWVVAFNFYRLESGEKWSRNLALVFK